MRGLPRGLLLLAVLLPDATAVSRRVRDAARPVMKAVHPVVAAEPTADLVMLDEGLDDAVLQRSGGLARQRATASMSQLVILRDSAGVGCLQPRTRPRPPERKFTSSVGPARFGMAWGRVVVWDGEGEGVARAVAGWRGVSSRADAGRSLSL